MANMQRPAMYPCHVVEIETPKNVRLNGLWFGTKKPKSVIVWVHGLGGSAFSMRHVISRLVNQNTAVLSFNNRGHDVMSRTPRGKKRIIAGAAHEVFADCADDIEGAIDFARKQKVKKIYLAGHSTGCQKSVYWASKQRGKGIAGIILLAPLSDIGTLTDAEKKLYPRALKKTRELVAMGKPHELLKSGLWSVPIDAQRFLSLYAPESVENSIFSYFDESKIPHILRFVHIPLLVLLAEKDEYADRPAQKIGEWFAKHARPRLQTGIIPAVTHNFKGAEKKVASNITRWIENTK